MSGQYQDVDATDEREPEDYPAMTPEQEKEFEEWCRRLVPACPVDPF